MKKHPSLVLMSLLLFTIIACGLQKSLNPPSGSSGDSVPLYPSAESLTLSETDRVAFIDDIFGAQYLRYISSTNVSWTKDTGLKVQAQFDKILPDSNWRLDIDWIKNGYFYASVWKKGDLKVLIAYLDNLTSEYLNELNRRYGMSIADTGTTLIVIHIWDTSKLVPSATYTNTFTPRPTNTPLPTSTVSVTPTASITTTASLTPTQTPLPYSGLIIFSSENDQKMLNPMLGWQPGSSNASAYDLTMNPGSLTIISGSGVDQWQNTNTAPLIILPYEGDFETRVKVVCTPGPFIQVAGIGVRSTQASNTWLRITYNSRETNSPQIWVVGDRQGSDLVFDSVAYSSNFVYLKIERRNSIFTFSYSSSGQNWVVLKQNFVFELPSEIEIFLVVFSNHNDEGFVAQFQDFSVYSK